MPYEMIDGRLTVDDINANLANRVMLQAIDSLVVVHKIPVYSSEVTRTTVCDADFVEETRRETENS